MTVVTILFLLSGIKVLPGAVLFGIVWQWMGLSSVFALAVGNSGRKNDSGCNTIRNIKSR